MDLKKLTDPDVLYNLPDGFLLIDYFYAPKVCFSLGVGEHTINLDHAVDLCSRAVSGNQQVNFVYVTPSHNFNNITRWQSYDTGSEGINVRRLVSFLLIICVSCLKLCRYV